MAVYSNINYLTHNIHVAFNVDHSPGQSVPFSGIYRCLGCHREVVAEKARQFPPQNHHQHNYMQGNVRWRLIVYADQEPK